MYKFYFEKLLMLSFLTLSFVACGPDDEVEKPKTTEPIIALSFNAQNPPVSVPGPLNASSNQRAKEIVDILRSVNAITSYNIYFIVPADASVSNTPIAGSSFQNANTTVYSWIFNDNSQFVNTSYQISEIEGNYKFEIYFDYGEGLKKSLEGSESVNESNNGYLLDYGLEGATQAQLNYEWTESTSEGFKITLVNASIRSEVTISPDNSGRAEVFDNGVATKTFTWNAAGTSGTYEYYNSNGTVQLSGSWAG